MFEIQASLDSNGKTGSVASVGCAISLLFRTIIDDPSRVLIQCQAAYACQMNFGISKNSCRKPVEVILLAKTPVGVLHSLLAAKLIFFYGRSGVQNEAMKTFVVGNTKFQYQTFILPEARSAFSSWPTHYGRHLERKGL